MRAAIERRKERPLRVFKPFEPTIVSVARPTHCLKTPAAK
jgi:hypothetical protein